MEIVNPESEVIKAFFVDVAKILDSKVNCIQCIDTMYHVIHISFSQHAFYRHKKQKLLKKATPLNNILEEIRLAKTKKKAHKVFKRRCREIMCHVADAVFREINCRMVNHPLYPNDVWAKKSLSFKWAYYLAYYHINSMIEMMKYTVQ
jgi:hypothetical protein